MQDVEPEELERYRVSVECTLLYNVRPTKQSLCTHPCSNTCSRRVVELVSVGRRRLVHWGPPGGVHR